MEADDAVNFGAIGAIIGHEIGHGFDDEGSKFDGAGNMVDWWTDPDRKEFEVRAKMLIEQYNGFEPAQLPGRKKRATSSGWPPQSACGSGERARAHAAHNRGGFAGSARLSRHRC
jgi:Peptidase family M13